MDNLFRPVLLAILPIILVALNSCDSSIFGNLIPHAAPFQSGPPATAFNGNLLAQRMPRILYRGGSFMHHPRIVTITFKNDDVGLVSRLEQFGNMITRTPWWRIVTEGYCTKNGDCIEEGRSSLAVRLTETLPSKVHAVDISALLRSYVSNGRLRTLDPDTLLLVYLPKGVSLRDAFISSYCGDGPHAYHKTLRIGNHAIGYAVMPRCGDEAALTGTASHEILEIVTNPDINHRGFSFIQNSANLGFTAAGIEAMDPCGFIAQEKVVMESSFVVRRAWSNKSAEQGRDPCVPTDTNKPYFALAPRQSTIRLSKEGEIIKIRLDAAASQDLPEWAISAIDLTGIQEHAHYVEVSLDKPVVSPGQTATLTITLRKQYPKRFGIVGIFSTLGDYSYMWPMAVVTL